MIRSYNKGVKIINNSWGYDIFYYNSECRQADTYMYILCMIVTDSASHDDFIAIFAAGNDGDMGYNTVSSPALAKNVITVGAAGTRSYNSVNENYVMYFSSRGGLSSVN